MTRVTPMRIRIWPLLLAQESAAGAQEGARTPLSIDELYRSDAPRSLAL